LEVQISSPAQAGEVYAALAVIYKVLKHWIPAFAGMTAKAKTDFLRIHHS